MDHLKLRQELQFIPFCLVTLSFHGSGIWEWLSWVVLAWGFSSNCSKAGTVGAGAAWDCQPSLHLISGVLHVVSLHGLLGFLTVCGLRAVRFYMGTQGSSSTGIPVNRAKALLHMFYDIVVEVIL